jgi:hypothetical protein
VVNRNEKRAHGTADTARLMTASKPAVRSTRDTAHESFAPRWMVPRLPLVIQKA